MYPIKINTLETNERNLSLKKLALIVGLSLLSMAIVAGVGYGYAFGNVYVENNASLTIQNLKNNKSLLFITIAAFVIIAILDVIVSVGIYFLFKEKHRRLSITTTVLRLIYTTILCCAIYYLIVVAVKEILIENRDSIIHSFHMFLKIWSLGLIFFGVHLFRLGLLLLRKKLSSAIVYILLLIAGVCYTVTNLADWLFPWYSLHKENVEMIISIPMALGELAFALWLVFKRKWDY